MADTAITRIRRGRRYNGDMDSPAHYRLSPSSSKRWLACPHSQWAGEGEPHVTAAAGTAVHELSEQWLLDPSPYKPLFLLEQTAFVECERHLAGTKYASNAAAIAAAGPAYVSTVTSLDGKLITETKLKHPQIADFGGTLDTCVVGDRLTIVDLKTGKFPVYPTDPQLLCYALLAREEHDWADAVHVVIVQPRAFKEPQKAKISRRQMDVFERRVQKAAVSDEVVPGQHCRFCPFLTKKECKPGVTYARSQGW